jgi:hypothetical protein
VAGGGRRTPRRVLRIADVIQAQFRARDPGVRGEAIRAHLNFLRSL